MGDKTTIPDLPKRVRALEAKDISRGIADNFRGKRCLVGWLDHQFGGPDLILRMESLLPARYRGSLPVATFNDDLRNSKSKVASVWNRFVKSLGYTRRGRWFVLQK